MLFFLFFSIPIAAVSGVVAWMSWRARHKGVAFTMAGICAVFSGISLTIIVVSLFFYQAWQTG
ncbi:hypothetical protein C2E25_12375 [Geothermobacter hydrogeniphilus]|uniref:Uncharacterized protein n=1 Tax=Geothermobacter hydrogeniphilus TaxID=1969733 RepID=A0A1X0YCL2_9BACT|nr:hypothetical protein [Geothermobacter hydrogeniphilus]ORJ62842.1 hypothetical protein B5V00_01935 [Geothermobacter hydrogeniphilus]PNU19452.1 hypothetical protein C2E25_12375 [Geothermobacter hydrogeniphilus]